MGKRLRLLGTLLLLCTTLCGQKRPLEGGRELKAGFSVGAGGLHWYLGPSAEVYYRSLRVHLVPGLAYAGVGAVVQLGPVLRRPDCNHRPFYLAVGVLDDWLLGRSLRPNDIANRTVFLGTLGLHHALDVRGRKYLEYGVGVLHWRRTRTAAEGKTPGLETGFAPMLELRLGGIFRWPVPPR
ncbi:MAG: hypothetical protein SFY70_11395 [Bacteroidia bacterium]|nr:hypothetical protein [Bacteroidia bacterium]